MPNTTDNKKSPHRSWHFVTAELLVGYLLYAIAIAFATGGRNMSAWTGIFVMFIAVTVAFAVGRTFKKYRQIASSDLVHRAFVVSAVMLALMLLLQWYGYFRDRLDSSNEVAPVAFAQPSSPKVPENTTPIQSVTPSSASAQVAGDVQRSMRAAVAIAQSHADVPPRVSAFKSKNEEDEWLNSMSLLLDAHISDPIIRIAFLKSVHYEAIRSGVDPQLVLAMIEVLSNFEREKVGDNGPRGLMQVNPEWVQLIGNEGDDLFASRLNVRYGCVIFRHYLDVERGDLYRALNRYHNQVLGSPNDETNPGNPTFAREVEKRWKGKYRLPLNEKQQGTQSESGNENPSSEGSPRISNTPASASTSSDRGETQQRALIIAASIGAVMLVVAIVALILRFVIRATATVTFPVRKAYAWLSFGAAAIGVSIATSVVFSDWFGPTDTAECVEKYENQAMRADAKRVIQRACAWGYSGSVADDLENVGRCVVRDAKEMYSAEATQAIVHRCTSKYESQVGFNTLVSVLRQDFSNSSRPDAKGAFTIMDVEAGEPRECRWVGNLLHCL